MSTVEDFRNAPVGATATHAFGSRAMKVDGVERRWVIPSGRYVDDESMECWDYTLDLPAPTTAREALDLAWELAHEVKEGQVIPKGARYLERPDFGLKEYTSNMDFRVAPGVAPKLRTLEPLPEPESDPEPGWLDAPAVLATCGCRGIELWQPHEEKDNMWVSVSRGEHVRWSTLRDVTPLYPKGQEA